MSRVISTSSSGSGRTSSTSPPTACTGRRRRAVPDGANTADPETTVKVEWWQKKDQKAPARNKNYSFKLHLSNRRRWVSEIPRSSFLLTGLNGETPVTSGALAKWSVTLDAPSKAAWDGLTS